MREIKFRAWHDGGKHPESASMLYVGDSYGTTHPLDCCRFAAEGQPVKLMQYTGLKDKSGVEIYEGDLVEGLIQGGLCKVIYEEDGFRLKSIRERGCQYCWDDIKIVGNIHENPELLNQ